MICDNCRRDNPPEANFCSFCGGDLRHSHPRRSWLVPAVILFALLGGLTAYLGIHSRGTGRAVPGPTADTPAPAAAPSRKPAVAFSEPVVQEPPVAVEPVIGVVLIRDVVGNPRGRIPSAVSRGGWVALPTASCLIGSDWFLLLATGQQPRIEGGLIDEGDEVGIWRLEPGFSIDSPPLIAWREDQPLNWHSIVSADAADNLAVEVLEERLYMTRVALPGEVAGPGVFSQGPNLVGWSFDELPGIGFLWHGAEGERLGYGISVADFYRLNFADGREERFLLALSQPELPAAVRLQALAAGFLAEKRLPASATPVLLSDAAAVEQLRNLVDRLRQGADTAAIRDALNGEVLAAAASFPLLVDAVEAVAEGGGPAEAVQLLESLEFLDPAFLQPHAQSLDDLLARLYRRWLSALIDNQDVTTGWQVYTAASNRHPGDPYIHLMGVQLALDSGDRALAQRLLASRDYPDALAERVRALEAQLAPQKADTAENPIRFSPNAGQVRVSAVLNDRVSQAFILDTGATVVTIPQATAERLGLDRIGYGRYREVYTAGGMVQAREVELDALELQGKMLRNVKALVMDLPGRPDVGLLGMNVLSRFRVDLNSETGELVLTPR